MKELDQNPTQWFVFFKDQLLLKKERTEKGEIKYSVPYGTKPPLKPGTGSTIHEVFLPTDEMVHAFDIEQLVEETEDWIMVNLRGSYEYITLDDYKAAGKAYQILYWDQHSRFCPVCGTPTEQQTAIMKKCPSCAYEIYPPISTAIIVLIRRGEELCWCMHATSAEHSTDW